MKSKCCIAPYSRSNTWHAKVSFMQPLHMVVEYIVQLSTTRKYIYIHIYYTFVSRFEKRGNFAQILDSQFNMRVHLLSFVFHFVGSHQLLQFLRYGSMNYQTKCTQNQSRKLCPNVHFRVISLNSIYLVLYKQVGSEV